MIKCCIPLEYFHAKKALNPSNLPSSHIWTYQAFSLARIDTHLHMYSYLMTWKLFPHYCALGRLSTDQYGTFGDFVGVSLKKRQNKQSSCLRFGTPWISSDVSLTMHIYVYLYQYQNIAVSVPKQSKLTCCNRKLGLYSRSGKTSRPPESARSFGKMSFSLWIDALMWVYCGLYIQTLVILYKLGLLQFYLFLEINPDSIGLLLFRWYQSFVFMVFLWTINSHAFVM